MAKIEAVQAELVKGHDVTGPYSLDDAIAAGEMNIVNIPTTESFVPQSLRDIFLTLRRNDMVLVGRLQLVAAANIGEDPLGDGFAGGLTLEHITSAKAMVWILTPSSLYSVKTDTATFISMIDDIGPDNDGGCEVITNGQKSAILSLSDSFTSSVIKYSLGKVSEGTIERARE